MNTLDLFSLEGKTAIVTGGEGFLGRMICDVVRELGGYPFSMDIAEGAHHQVDVRSGADMDRAMRAHDRIDILVNAAVGNQRPGLHPIWGLNEDIGIGLAGAAIAIEACQFKLKEARGMVLNIGSDLGMIAPDQSLYPDNHYKPASYSAVKHGLIGLTRYYAALWGQEGVRVNCLCPGSIDQGQAVPTCPLGRLARLDEMRGPIAFMLSAASSYMTGAVVVVDGGRTAI